MGRACSVQTGDVGRTWGNMDETWEGHGKDMGRTWEGHGKDMGRAWGEHGKNVWGDVRTWEGHGETWEGHGETWKERVRVGGDMERYRVT